VGDTLPRGDGDRFFGPGAYDMKGGAFIATYALGVLLERGHTPRLSVTFLFVPDEEIGSPTGNGNCWTSFRSRSRSAGNQWATLRGASPQAVVIGSHIDSVPDGGWLDGCLGVLAALEVMRAIAAESTPPLTVRLVGNLRDAEGMTAREALAAHGVDVETMGRARAQLQNAVAYIELHIEQGPVLEDRCLPLAVVTGTYGDETVVCAL
jgi:hypothetical protein